MKHLIRNLAYQLTRKRVEEASLAVSEIRKKREELLVFSLSTNTVISFEHEGQTFYFRECPRLLSADDFWRTTIDRFFDSLDRLGINRVHFAQEIPVRIRFAKGEIQDFRAYIASRAHDRSFRKMLNHADQISRRVGFSIWQDQNYGPAFFEAFSMTGMPEHCQDIAVYFLWNMRSAAENYRLMKLVRGKRHSFFAAVRSAASYVIAQELGLANMITPALWCRLVTDDGEERFGLMSPAAPGGRMIDTDISATPSLQRELLCLNVLDVICHQTDHGPNNYNVTVDVSGEVSVCAFDNDNPQTCFPMFSISRPLAGCAPLVDKHGQIFRPCMDRELAERLGALDQKKLCRRLRPYLNRLQIAAVRYRLCGMKRAIDRTEKIRPGFLVEPSAWSGQTVSEEISGAYGETYLKKISRSNSNLA